MDAAPLNAAWWRRDGADVILNVSVQPRARREDVGDIVGGYLKVHLTAPPVEGAANEALRAFLAKRLHVSKRRVVLERGETTRRKQIRIQALTANADLLELFRMGVR